jgi:hypothetical protein
MRQRGEQRATDHRRGSRAEQAETKRQPTEGLGEVDHPDHRNARQGLADDAAVQRCRRMAGGHRHREDGRRDGSSRDQRTAGQQRREHHALVAHPERRPGPPQQVREAEADRGLLDVEPLEEIQHAGCEQQRERELVRPVPPACQRPGDAKQRQPGGQRQRVRNAQVSGGRDGEQLAHPDG